MRKLLSYLVIIIFLYLAAEIIFLVAAGKYSLSFAFLLSIIGDGLLYLSNISSSPTFDWTWFILLLVNVLIALILTLYYAKTRNDEKKNDLLLELRENIKISEKGTEHHNETIKVKHQRESVHPVLISLDDSKIHVEHLPKIEPTKAVSKVIYKKELSKIVSTKTEMSEYKSLQAINSLIDIIEYQVNEKNSINIENLGKFTKKHRVDKVGTNPNTGESIMIPGHNTVTFKHDQWLWDNVNHVVVTSEKEEIAPIAKVNQKPIKEVAKAKSRTLYKKEISQIVSKKTDLSEYKALQVINTLTNIVEEELRTSSNFVITNLGKFTKKHRAEKIGTNPNNGESIVIPGHNTVTFKNDEWLHDFVNGTLPIKESLEVKEVKEIKEIRVPKVAVVPTKKPKTVILHKKEISILVSHRTGMSEYKSLQVINHLITIIEEELRVNTHFNLPQIGKLTKKHRAEKIGTNPNTKEPIVIPEHNTVTFKQDDWLKEYLMHSVKGQETVSTVTGYDLVKKVTKHLGKTEITEMLAKKINVSNYKAKIILNSLLNIVEEELVLNGTVSIPEIGKFEKKHRDAQKGVNPNTKEIIYIASHDVVKFKSSKTLKEQVNK